MTTDAEQPGSEQARIDRFILRCPWLADLIAEGRASREADRRLPHWSKRRPLMRNRLKIGAIGEVDGEDVVVVRCRCDDLAWPCNRYEVARLCDGVGQVIGVHRSEIRVDREQ